MPPKEHFYTADFFQSAGIESFKKHVEEYLNGLRTVPVSRTKSSQHGYDIFFTFSDPLLERFIDQIDSIKKPYEVALKFGLGGYSKGGKNGIFYLRKEDKRLISAVYNLTEKYETTVRKDLDFKKNGLDELAKVKIVWHKPSGERVVGAYNKKNNRILFLDFAKY